MPEKPEQAGPEKPAAEKPTTYIFHVLLKDGESLLLDPFRGVERLESTLSERTVAGGVRTPAPGRGAHPPPTQREQGGGAAPRPLPCG
ncbi:MAG: hypothetical protein OXC31_28065, partial [Spirochaetaceae bacterium]|nr:hypothetical protein [Spirochaetaceae bacterium]